MPFYQLAAELNSVSKVKVRGPFHKTILWQRSILWLRYHHIRFTKLSWILIILRSLIILRQPNTCLKSNFMMTGAYNLVHHRRSSIVRVRFGLGLCTPFYFHTAVDPVPSFKKMCINCTSKQSNVHIIHIFLKRR